MRSFEVGSIEVGDVLGVGGRVGDRVLVRVVGLRVVGVGVDGGVFVGGGVGGVGVPLLSPQSCASRVVVGVLVLPMARRAPTRLAAVDGAVVAAAFVAQLGLALALAPSAAFGLARVGLRRRLLQSGATSGGRTPLKTRAQVENLVSTDTPEGGEDRRARA